MTARDEKAPESGYSRSLQLNIMIASSGAIAAIMFNALPAFLGALAESMTLSNAQLGALVSAYFLGHTSMTIVAGLAYRRFNLLRTAVAAALLTASCFSLMLVFHSYAVLMALLVVAGLGGGVLFVLALTVLATGDRATRDIALCFLLQLLLGAAVVYLCPAMITPRWGFSGVVVLFAALFILNAALATAYGRAAIVSAPDFSRDDSHSKPVRFEVKPSIALFSMMVSFVGLSPVWAFLERMGYTAGFDPGFVGTVLMGSLLMGALASLGTVMLENRVGLRIPLAFSWAMIVAALLVLAYGGDADPTLFAVGVIVFQFFWVFGVNYIAAAVAWLDDSGNHASLTPAAIGVGIVLGPVVGGMISADGFRPLLWLGIGVTVFVLVTLSATPLLKGVRQYGD